jgi:hypothetical protein
MLLIIAGILACGVTATFVLDSKCAADIAAWMPPYPGAELVQVEHDFFRPFAMGQTSAVYYSNDDARTIRNWYIDVQKKLDNDGATRGLATTNLHVQSDPSGGNLIMLNSECASR